MKKGIGCFISLCIIYIVMSCVYKKRTISNECGQNDFQYIVQFSKSLRMIYSLVFYAGIVLTLFFGIVKIKWGGGVTAGHLWFSLVLTSIGIVFILMEFNWTIQDDGEKFTVYSFSHTRKELQFSDIDRVEEGSDGEITLYKNGKKIVTVENAVQNYDRFRNTLKQYEKI